MTYEIRYKAECEYIVHVSAVNEVRARQKFESGDWDDEPTEIACDNMEIQEIHPTSVATEKKDG